MMLLRCTARIDSEKQGRYHFLPKDFTLAYDATSESSARNSA